MSRAECARRLVAAVALRARALAPADALPPLLARRLRRLGPTIGKMVRLLDEQLARVNAVRLEVVWPEGAGPLTLAKVTGREAHLHFLDSTLFYRLFLQTMGRRYLCE